MSFVALKHIPCPAGDNCTAFLCLFKHDKDKDLGTSTPMAVDSETPKRTLDGSQGGPQKRLKIRHDKEEGSSSTSPAGDKVSSLARPISPPPLPFKRATPGPTTVHRPSTPAKRSSAALPSSNSSTTVDPSGSFSPSTPHTVASTSTNPNTPEPPKPRKAESLNPRLLKSAPAGHDMRYKLLKMIYQEFTRLNDELKKDANNEESKLVLSDQELTWRALDEEEKIAIEKAPIYSNVIKNRIMQYKRMTVGQWKDERVAEKKQQSQKRKPEKQPLGPPRKVDTGLNSKQEAQFLRRLITPVEDLSAHGYVSSVPQDEDIEKARQGLEASKGWEKCDRCDQRFQVFPGRREEDGVLASGGSCNYHYGKTYFPERQPGDRSQQQKRYRCCGQAVGDSAGCFISPNHVFKTSDAKRLATIVNFAKTPANPHAPTDRAVCFDCEMCYTVHGLELVRLTATSWRKGKVLLDVLVQPVGEILDLNSRYSGVWPEDMASAEPWSAGDSHKPSSSSSSSDSGDSDSETTKKRMKIVSSPQIARDLLFSLIAPETPLIGHGLENDLNTVRMIHPTLIDTVLLFPHKRGLPYRYGLKMLMETLLNKKIQVEAVGKAQGHDSAEDARAAGDLVRLKVMEEWKTIKLQGWTIGADGGFVPPQGLNSNEGQLTAEFLEGSL